MNARESNEARLKRLRRLAEERLSKQPDRVPASITDAVETLHELHVHQFELELQNEELSQARAEIEATLARYTHLYDFAPVGYFTLTRNGAIQRTNLAGARLLGMARSLLRHRRFGQFVIDQDLVEFDSFLERVFAGNRQESNEIRLQASGNRPEIVINIHAIHDEKENECRVVASDITERKLSEARLELAASVFTHAQEGIMILDADGRIVEVNRSFIDITGYPLNEVINKAANIFDSGCHEPEFYTKLWAALKSKGHWYGEIWDRRKDGDLYAAILRINAVRNASGEAQHYVALFSDITALKEHQNQLERLAHYDALTGLPNRVLLADRLKHAMAQTRRRENFMALVYLDLDGFKAVNDIHGHETGDELLIVVAQRLKDALREGDTLARLGGDEFVAVLADLGSRNECEIILARLLQAASSPVHIKDQVLLVSASLGVTLSPQDGGDAEILLRHADQAMYQAKQAGKNRYHLFDPELDLHALTHHDSLQRIALALEKEEFVLYYQPKINMRSGEVIGVEALIRWQHPDRGLLLPEEFINTIENNELISRVGDWVLDTALTQLTEWHKIGLDIPVSVNIAAYHLQQEDFLLRVRDKLAAHPDLRPDQLELEVLETAALADISRISRVIGACQGLGVEFSLDDFGTGYSSLTYLKRLPAMTLKIDQSFVRNMLWDKEDLAIVEGVLGLATAFGRHVVAEGVETIDHAKLLLRLGCERAQGSYFASAMPAGALPEWVRRWKPDPAWKAERVNLPSGDNLTLIYAEVDHRQWIRRIESALHGAADTSPLDPRTCQFGLWQFSDGNTHCGHLPEYLAVLPVHEKLHALAQELLALHAADQTELALERLGELHALRDLFIERLRELSSATASALLLAGPRKGLRKATIPLL